MEKKDKKPYINVDFFEDLTGDLPDADRPGIEEIGQRIRGLRESKGLTLEALANMTGFEPDLLARIETNEVQPQLGTVMKLSKALDGAFGRLVSGVGDQLYAITRSNARKSVSRSTSSKGKKHLYSYKSLAPEVHGRHMEALVVQLEENPDPEHSVHGGEEFIFVLDGVVSFQIGDNAYELEIGDSAYYLSTTPHVLAAKTGKATILAVLYEG
ncbi:MAG: XRE family transcriptional regulator [Pseudomonadota bacterium]